MKEMSLDLTKTKKLILQIRKKILMKSKTLFILAACIGTAGAYSLSSSSSEEEMFCNRYWVDRLEPQNKEYMNIVGFVDRPSIGLVARMSEFQTHSDMVSWNKSGEEISYTNLQDGVTETFKYHVFECDEKGFELCMDVSVGQSTKRYYSLWEWEIDSKEDLNIDAVLK